MDISRKVVSRAVALLLLVAGTSATAQELNWAEKMFSELKHDFGVVARGADVRHQIVITNLYEEDIEITNVGTTCGCTAARPDRNRLKTHEKAYIEVKMNTEKFMRRKDSNVDVTVTFDGGSSKTVRIPITAYIRSDVVLKPGNADFGSVEFGIGAKRTLDIAYAGRNDWNLRGVRNDNPHLKAEVVETSRGNGRVNYQLSVQLDPNTPLGSVQDRIYLLTDDANSPEVPVLVMAKVEPDIVVTPETLPLGVLRPGVEKQISVVFKGKRPFTIVKIECASSRDCFSIRFTDEQKALHVVPLKVTAPNTPGDFEEEFSVTIAGRPEPLTFRAVGRIEAGS